MSEEKKARPTIDEVERLGITIASGGQLKALYNLHLKYFEARYSDIFAQAEKLAAALSEILINHEKDPYTNPTEPEHWAIVREFRKWKDEK